MTSDHRPSPSLSAAAPRGIVLRTAVVAALAAGLVAILGAFVGGSSAAAGGLVGGLLVALVFGSGALAVDLMARRSATEAMLTAITTYLGQVIVLVGGLVLLSRSGLVGDQLSRGWLAGGVVAVALTWSVGQILLSRAARIPTYDLPGEGG